MSVIRRYRFEAAHQLEWHPGKCRALHGHSYVLELRVEGELDRRGVVMDFAEVDQIAGPIVEALDHSYLNDLMPNPTAELVAAHIAERLSADGLLWASLRLWETEDGSVLVER